jgi:hypothetical protein
MATRTADRSSQYTGWSRQRIEKRISGLSRRVRASTSMDHRAMLRTEIDMLLDEHFRRYHPDD